MSFKMLRTESLEKNPGPPCANSASGSCARACIADSITEYIPFGFSWRGLYDNPTCRGECPVENRPLHFDDRTRFVGSHPPKAGVSALDACLPCQPDSADLCSPHCIASDVTTSYITNSRSGQGQCSGRPASAGAHGPRPAWFRALLPASSKSRYLHGDFGVVDLAAGGRS